MRSGALAPALGYTQNQLHLETLASQFAGQAANARSIAFMSGANLAGQAARLGFLSLGCGGLLAQAGSVAIEGASLAGFEHAATPGGAGFLQSGLQNAINVGVFRLLSPLRFSNAALQQGLQAGAMMGGQQAACWLGLVEAPREGLAAQFFESLATNLRLQAGASLGHFLTGGRLARLQGELESASVRAEQAAGVEMPLTSMGAQQPPGPRGRKGTDVVDRVSRPVRVMNVENPEEILGELHAFSARLDAAVNALSHFIEHTLPGQVTIKDVHHQHARLFGTDAAFDWRGAFRSRLDEFAGAIKEVEGAAHAQTPATQSQPSLPSAPAARGVLGWIHYFFTFQWMRSRQASATPAALPAPRPRPSLAQSEIQSHREAYTRLYDQLVLLQEATRIVGQDHEKAPPETLALLRQIESAYESLHENLQQRREALRRSTTRIVQIDLQQFIDQWGNSFLRGVRNLRVSRNLQTLLGRVYLAEGEHIGGSFFGAFHEATRRERAHIFLSVYYDRETAQIVAFDDGSQTAAKTLHNLRAARRPLVKVHYVVDAEESGRIIDVECTDERLAAPVQEVIRGLVGLQVARENYIQGYADLDPASARYIISNRIDAREAGDVIYDIIARAQPQGRQQTLLTLREHGKPESANIQLWVGNSQATRLPPQNHVVRLRRIH